MNRDEFKTLVGDSVHHITLAQNIEGIEKVGLLRPSTVTQLCGIDTNTLKARREPIELQYGDLSVKLNHQKPLLAGRNHESEFLDGHNIDSWSRKLDDRLFFWPGKARTSFVESLNDRGPQAQLTADSGEFFDAFASCIDLSPINSGSAKRRPSKRGDWIYVPAKETVEAYRTNRINRGLVTSRDSVTEISLRKDILVADISMFKIRYL